MILDFFTLNIDLEVCSLKHVFTEHPVVQCKTGAVVALNFVNAKILINIVSIAVFIADVY